MPCIGTTTLLLVLMLVVARAARGDEDAFVFATKLTGAQEVAGPPFVAPQLGMDTATAVGLHVWFDRGFTTVHVRLGVPANLGSVEAHLHCAPAGMNGPIAASLGRFDETGAVGEVRQWRRALTNGDIQAGVSCDATCGKPVNNIASLRAAMIDGCIYADVHLPAHREGLVRGQVHGRSCNDGRTSITLPDVFP